MWGAIIQGSSSSSSNRPGQRDCVKTKREWFGGWGDRSRTNCLDDLTLSMNGQTDRQTVD